MSAVECDAGESNASELKVDIEAALAFLRMVVPKDGNGNLVAIDSQNPKDITGVGFKGEDLETARKFIEAHAHQNLYWTVNGLGVILDRKPTKEHITEMRFGHLDHDDSTDATLEQIRSSEPPPTHITFSGGGYWGFWQLATAVPVNAANIDALEDTIDKQILRVHGLYHDGKGRKDNTWNIDRLARLPGSVNWLSKKKRKDGRKVAAAYVVESHPERLYTLEQLRGITCSKVNAQGAEATAEPTEQPKEKKRKVKSTKAEKADRSNDLMAKVAKYVRQLHYKNKLSEKQIRLQIHSEYDSHPHAQDQADPKRAVDRCIDKVYRELVSNQTNTDIEDLFATIRTADTITCKEYIPVQYLTKERVPRGVVLLSARPKMKKSFFALQAVVAAAKGGEFLDQPTHKGRSLGIFLEDNERRMQQRFKFMGVNEQPIEEQQLMHVVHAWPKGDPGVDALREWMKRYPDTTLIVIDVLQKFRAPPDRGQAAYAADYAAFEKLTALAREYPDLTILVLHHNRKGTSDTPSEKVSGTLALVGAADAYIILDTNKDKDEPNTYTAHMDGRDWELWTHDFILRFEEGGWRFVRAVATDEDTLTATQREWLALVKNRGSITPSQAAEAKNVTASAACQNLTGLERRGFLTSKKGVYTFVAGVTDNDKELEKSM